MGRQHCNEPSQFTEKCLDAPLMNWYIRSMGVFLPKFKKIFVDDRDDDLFAAIDRSEHKRIVCVVN